MYKIDVLRDFIGVLDRIVALPWKVNVRSDELYKTWTDLINQQLSHKQCWFMEENYPSDETLETKITNLVKMHLKSKLIFKAVENRRPFDILIKFTCLIIKKLILLYLVLRNLLEKKKPAIFIYYN